MRDKQTENKTELKRLTKEIKFLESHDVCPTCTQVIGDGFKETRMSSLTTTGSGLTTDAESIEKNIDEILSAIDKIEKICEEMYSVRSEVSSLDRDILRLKKRI